MRDERNREERPGPSRRSFLQTTATFAAASVAVGVGSAEAQGEPAGDCECAAQSALPVFGAAFVDGEYVGLASTPKGPGVFQLKVDGARRVTLGRSLGVDLPEGFAPAALGLAHGRLAVGGGRPFLWESYEVDDGARVVEVMGVEPAAFILDPPFAEPLALPEMPRRVFASVGAVAETDGGGLVVLVEHSGELPESWYGAAVDVLEERHGVWSVAATAADLGESGPNHLAVSGEDFLVGLNGYQGPVLLGRAGSALSSPAVPAGAGRILGVVAGAEGFRVLGPDPRGRVRTWSLGPSALGSVSTPIRIGGDEIVGAVPVVGGKGQSILLGRRSALLVEDASVVASRAQKKEESHVL